MTGGLILAAGVSSRMKRYKPMLKIGSTTFIRKLIGDMRSCGIGEIVVVTGYRHEELEAHLADADVTCVYNERFYCSQMLDSVKLGLGALPEDCGAVLLSPVDVVMSPLTVFRTVMEEDADFVRPVYRGEPGHPVLIRRSLFGYIMDYEGAGGLRGAAESSGQKIRDIETDEPDILLDADTLGDYRKVLAEYDRRAGEQGKLNLEPDVDLVCGDLVCDDSFMQMLELIGATGSLQNAAQAMHISYTTAWKSLRHAETITSRPLTLREAGGGSGGSSTLTENGKEFLRRYKQMKEELNESGERIFAKYFSDYRI